MTPLKSQLTVNNMLRIYDTKERKNQLDVAKTKTAYESFLIDDVINMGINIDLDMALKQKYYYEKNIVDKKINLYHNEVTVRMDFSHILKINIL